MSSMIKRREKVETPWNKIDRGKGGNKDKQDRNFLKKV